MDVDSILLKIKLRLNKLDSQDYDNLEVWQLLELYNRAQLLFTRQNLHGLNIIREGDEASKRRIDDFNRLLKNESLLYTIKDGKLITHPLPDDYMVFKRLTIKACNECCDKDINVYLVKSANENIIKNNSLYNCSFEWGETYTISEGNKFIIDVSCLNEVEDVILTYYRYPVNVEKTGHFNIYTKAISVNDVGSEFTLDTTELIIELACQMAGSDIQDGDIYQMRNQNYQNNN